MCHAGDMTNTQTAVEPQTLVYYHGSIEHAHGFYTVVTEYSNRYILAPIINPVPERTLHGARRQSFTVVPVPEVPESDDRTVD